MFPEKRRCNKCGGEIEVKEYSSFIVCSYCSSRVEFDGFNYKKIDHSSSMYINYEYWCDCPKCRSENMVYSDEKKCFVCLDCKYEMTPERLEKSILWFCDDCEAYLNIQSGFSTNSGHWKCKKCGYENDVSKDNTI